MTKPSAGSDRVLGSILVAIGLSIAFEARTFVVSFVTDPLGPRALPMLVAAVLVVSGVALVVRPGPGTEWPDGTGWRRIAVATASLLVYSVTLAPFGFFLATTVEVTALALLFGGRLWPSSLAAAGFTGVLYVVFVFLLRLSLPIGTVFIRGG